MLELRDIGVRFGGLNALDGVSLAVASGEIVGLVGPNGAGKTTLFNVISGTIRPQRGTLHFDGTDISGMPAYARARRRVGRTFQIPQPMHTLTVAENVAVAQRFGTGRTDARAQAEILDLVELTDHATRDAATELSLTELKSLEVAKALATQPRLLLLDEVLAGLEAQGKRRFTQLLGEIHARYKLAILIIEHDIETISTLCPRAAVLDFGHLIADGTPAHVFSQPDVVASYTGTVPPMLEVRGVRAGYGPINVLWDVDLRFESGKLTTIIGPNGAGKTTLLRAIMGQIPVTQGEITLDGRRLDGTDTWRLADLGIALIPEGRMVFRDMSVAENLLLGAYPVRAQARVAQRIDAAYAMFPRLFERRTQLAGSLSGGEAQMLAMARGLMSEPKLLLIDEPSLGLAPIVVQEIFALLARLKAERRTIVLVEQNTQRAVQVADQVYLMQGGRVVLTQAAADVDLEALHDRYFAR